MSASEGWERCSSTASTLPPRVLPPISTASASVPHGCRPRPSCSSTIFVSNSDSANAAFRHRPMRWRPLVVAAAVCGLLGTGLAMPVAAKETASEAPATQLRVALDRVLAEHAFLIVQVMRTGLTPGPEFDAAAD